MKKVFFGFLMCSCGIFLFFFILFLFRMENREKKGNIFCDKQKSNHICLDLDQNTLVNLVLFRQYKNILVRKTKKEEKE